MFMPTRDIAFNEKGDEFSRPVESIMKCEDFKSNFARRLSNRYISRSPSICLKQNSPLTLHPLENKTGESVKNMAEVADSSTLLSKNSKLKQNDDIAKTPDKAAIKIEEIKSTEIAALNMEVKTLKWQLAQTEANRQMNLALLKQIVSFLSRIREHMEFQNVPSETSPRKVNSPRLPPKSCNATELPRSRSVVHVNKNMECSLSPVKKMNFRKLSKSISNVNGFRDFHNNWNQSRLSLTQETDSGQKITEEISRLIILANTVLSTKIPDLTCTCTNPYESTTTSTKNIPTDKNVQDVNDNQNNITSNECLDLIEEDGALSTPLVNTGGTTNTSDDNISSITNEKDVSTCSNSLSSLIISDLDTLMDTKILDKDKQNTASDKNAGIELSHSKQLNNMIEKERNFIQVSHYIEDESGFSSMSSFQEIGIPIINIIPPTPCKDVLYTEEDFNVLDGHENWKTGALDLDKQAVKVFWV